MSTKSSFTRVFMLVSIICSMLVPLLSTPSSFAQAPQPALPNQRPTQPSAGMPISFLPFNQRSLPHVKYQTHAFGGQVFFATDEVVLALPNPSDEVFKKGTNQEKSLRDLVIEAGDQPNKPVMPMKPIRMQFVQNNPATVITATKQADLRLNRLIGNDRTKWQTNVAVAETITYQHLYSGIDLEYTGANGQMKRTFKVAPHANPNVIEWRYKGHVDVQVDAGGNLVVVVAQKPKATKIATDTAHLLVESAPVAWQIINGEQRYVDIAFNILKNKSVGFTFGTYDPNYELIIDPTISYSTYLGGNGNDWAWDVAIDAQGSSYVTGFTTSYDFPTANSSVTANGEDVFVTKYTPTGDAIVFTTLLGGSSADRGQAIELDTQGNIWITGSTYSTDSPFGYTGYQTTLGGNKDAFVTRLSSDGVSVLYTSLLGGSGADHAHDLAVDTNNNVYIHGYTNSSDFPTFGAMQATFQGGSEAFVAKFMAGATGYGSLVYSTYLGGSGDEWGYGIDVDSAGNAYLTGFTLSADFPVSAGQASYAGNRDAYVVRLNDSGSIAFSTYLGGSGWDEGINIAVDTDGSYYVVGATYSTNFPTINASQSSLAGGMDGWFAKFEGDNRVTTTYFGGNGDDKIADLAIDANHDISVTGATQSSSLPSGMLPYGSLQSTHYGVDAFIAQFGLDRFGSSINNHYYVLYSSYFSGYGDDWGQGIAVAGANIYLVGGTSSTDFPVSNAVQAWLSSGSDAFIARISLDDDQIVNPGQPIQAGIEPATDIDTFYVDLEAGKEIIIRMDRVNEATGLNGYLTLLDPSGRAVASDNDTGRNGNAKINRFIVPTTGRYQIQAKDYAGTRTGPYTLTVSVGNPITPPPPAPPAGQDVDPCPAPTTPTSLPTEDPVTRGPENADFEQGMTELPRTTYPVNCDFAQPAQVLPTTITPATLSYGGGTNAIRTTDSFVVAANAQSLRFKYRHGTVNQTSNYLFYTFSVKVIGTTTTTTVMPFKLLINGWQEGTVDMQAFRGQNVSVEFSMSEHPAHRFDVKDMTLNVEVPNWISNNIRGVRLMNDQSGRNQHVRVMNIANSDVFVQSLPVQIPNNAQSIRFDFLVGQVAGEKACAKLAIVEGTTVTDITPGNDAFCGTQYEGWRTAVFDIRAFRGRTVQLRFTATNYLRLDSIRFAIETPFWEPKSIGLTEAIKTQIKSTNTEEPITETTILDGDFNQQSFLDTTTIVNPEQSFVYSTMPDITWSNQIFETSVINVADQADYLLFDLQTGPTGNESFSGTILSGAAFDISQSSLNTIEYRDVAGVRRIQVDISQYRGQSIKFRGTIGQNVSGVASNMRVVRLLPGWQRGGNNPSDVRLIADTPTTGHMFMRDQSWLTSDSIYIDDTIRTLTFLYTINKVNTAFQVHILSGESLTARSTIANVKTSNANTWQSAVIDVQKFRGQQIRIEFKSVNLGDYQVQIDNVALMSGLSQWKAKSSGVADINDTPREIVLPNTTNPSAPFLSLYDDVEVTTNAFRVVTTTLQFQYKVRHQTTATTQGKIYLSILSGANFADEQKDVANVVGNGTISTWSTGNLDLSKYAGRVVKIRFRTDNSFIASLDNVKLIPGLAGTPKASATTPQGNYLEIQPNNNAVSSPFVVPNDASFVNFMYQVGFQNDPAPTNDGDILKVEIQPQGGSTWTIIDGGIIKGRTIDGWKRGKVSLLNYRGQTIRLRFGANVTRARIDQISLLTARGSFSGSQLLAGTTYLNMPMTQFGGTTTPANVTVTSLNVYDEYTDLAGTVAYNGQTYTFSLFGNVFNSNLGHPEDKVGNLRDATGNFDVLYYAVRHTPLMPVANSSLTGDNLALYIQRKGTREITFVDVPLTGTLGSALWTSFGAKGRYGAAYIADQWIGSILKGTSETKLLHQYTIQTISHSTYAFDVSDTISGYRCLIIKHVVLEFDAEAPLDIARSNAQFNSTLTLTRRYTQAYDQPNSPYKYCQEQYGEEDSDIQVGTFDDAPQIAWQLDGDGQNPGTGDAFISAYFDGTFLKKVDPTSVYLNVGFSYLGASLNYSVNLGDREKVMAKVYNFKNNPPNRFAKKFQYTFTNNNLCDAEDYMLVNPTVAYKGGVRGQKAVRIDWYVQIYRRVGSSLEIIGPMYIVAILDYTSG